MPTKPGHRPGRADGVKALVSKDGTLKKRFTFKLTANILGMLLGLVTMSFVSRALGPENYGRFEFITNNYKLILDTLTLQVPVAYFNWVSRKGHKEEIDVASGMILGFSIAMTGLFACFILIAILSGFSSVLWPGIEKVFLWESLMFTLVVFLYQLLVYLSDGMSLTVGLEKIRLLQNVLKAVALLGLVVAGLMNLHTYFFAQITVIAITIALSARWLSKQGALSSAALKFRSWSRDERDRFLSFVKHYARPLTVLMFSGFVFIYFDRWFLQLIGGSTQQGFFGLSDRLGQIAFVFTGAMTPLLIREFAFAHEEGDRERMVRLFERIRLFLFIATVTSCFMSVQSRAIVQIIGGDKFRSAVVPIALMTLFPIHQTFGQLSGTFLVATGQTGLYAKIGILMMVISMPITYFCVAPSSYIIPGLGLGATGLAIKMIIWQLIGTNVQLYYNTKYLKIGYLKWVGIQAVLIGIIYGVAYVSVFAVTRIDISSITSLLQTSRVSVDVVSQVVQLMLSGIVYLILVGSVFLLAPGIAGIARHEVSFDVFSFLKK